MREFKGFKKGVNLGGWLSQCVSYEPEHFDTFIQKEDIERIASWGLDHVRLPIDYDIIQEEDESFKESGIKHVNDCIAWCKEYGLHVIIDLHKAKGYMFDRNAVENPDAFFEDQGLQDAFIRTWEELARRYGNQTDTIAFELLNEITNPAVEKKWNAIANRAIKAIRAISPDTYIVVGGVNYNSVSAIPGLDKPYDDKIVYTFHNYEPFIFTHQTAYWVDGMDPNFHTTYPHTVGEYRELGKDIAQAACGALYDANMEIGDCGTAIFEKLFAEAFAYAKEMNAPVYCGEYGVIDQAPISDTVAWFKDVNAVFEKYNIARAVWNYKDKDFGLVDTHYEDEVNEIVKYL